MSLWMALLLLYLPAEHQANAGILHHGEHLLHLLALCVSSLFIVHTEKTLVLPA